MSEGKTYTLTFDAWASEDRDIIACISAPNNDWIRYLQDQRIKITTSPQTYECVFTMDYPNDPAARLEFNLGAMESTASVYLDNISLKEAT